MDTTRALLPAVWFSTLLISCVAYSNVGPGTTPNISDTILGRCLEYRHCLMGEPCLPYYHTLDCAAVHNAFFQGIRFQDPCSTPDIAYDDFLAMAPPQTRKDKTTFWSGVAGANIPQDVAQVTEKHTVLEETLPGYLAGNLSWCGSTDPDDASGLNFTVCPTWRSADCVNNTKAAFWDRASKLLAVQAVGKTYVVLNSQRQGGAFNLGSVFARIEAPNLNPALVTNVALYLIPDFTLPIPNNMYRETCKNGSVLYLQQFLKHMGLNNTCEEDPTLIMWLQCARYPDSPYCEPYNRGSSISSVCAGILLLQALMTMTWSSWNTS